MTPRVGKCTNYSGCKLANRNEKIAVVARDFRCPGCGSPLESLGPKRAVSSILVLSIGVATVLILVIAAILWTLSRSAKRMTHVVELTPTPTLEPTPTPTSTPIATFTPISARETPPDDSDKLPTFFPPRATDRFPIPVRLAGENVTLQQLANRLSEALKNAGYEGKSSYYWLDDRHGPGFAIVTHVEHIQPDGKPVLDQRWGFDLPRYGPLTLGSLLRALMHADPGHYRLLALVVCKQPLIEKETPMTPDQMVILNKGPSWLGDSPWKTVVATADFHLIVYVYEFERKSRSDDPVLMVSSDLTAEQHLQSTGLYDDIRKEFSK